MVRFGFLMAESTFRERERGDHSDRPTVRCIAKWRGISEPVFRDGRRDEGTADDDDDDVFVRFGDCR